MLYLLIPICLARKVPYSPLIHPKYPSTAELHSMRLSSEAFGQADCQSFFRSEICDDYTKYWKTLPNAAVASVNSEDFAGFKLLIVSVGQTFRGGGFRSTASGDDSSVSGQREAAESHFAFARYLKKRYNIDTDFVVNTYTSQFQSLLQSWYPANTKFKFGTINPALTAEVAYQRLLNDGVDLARTNGTLTGYGAVLFIRADIFLKPGFFHYFRLFDRLTFSFIVQKSHSRLGINRRPQVGD